MITVTLPWPPTVNHMYGRTRNGMTFVTKEARQWKEAAAIAAKNTRPVMYECPVNAVWAVYAPDNRRRDLSNLMKASEDALNGIVWKDDSLIATELILRCEPRPDGAIQLWCWGIDEAGPRADATLGCLLGRYGIITGLLAPRLDKPHRRKGSGEPTET